MLVRHVHADIDGGPGEEILVDRLQVGIRRCLEDPLVQAGREIVVEANDTPGVAIFNGFQGRRLVVEVDRSCNVGIEKTEIPTSEISQVFVCGRQAHLAQRDRTLFGKEAFLTGLAVIFVVDNSQGKFLGILTDGHAEETNLKTKWPLM